VVTVSKPVQKSVTEYKDFIGTTAAVEKVDVKPRVWGYLKKVNFTDGAEVNLGDVLYEIDPSTYQAALDAAEAKVRLDQAQLAYNEAEYRRNLNLRRSGSVSQEDVEKSLAARDTAAASVQADQAQAAQSRLDLEYTKVIAPISGRMGRTEVTVGNLVQGGQAAATLLATLVSQAPMYAYFDVDERTMQRVQKLIREGKYTSARRTPRQILTAGVGLMALRPGNFVGLTDHFSLPRVPVTMALASDTGFPHQGSIDFVNNQVTASTGTLRVRAVFPNQERFLTPGEFVRVRVPIGNPHDAILVSDRALDSDQGQKFVYVVNDKNEVVNRPVTVGALYDGLREIEEGLNPDDRIIINGLQRVRPGVKVEPKEGKMEPGPFPGGKPPNGPANKK
jgi:RND family efflux transporter MFP subunit